MKDSAITAKIKAKLADEHVSSLAKVHVDTDASGMVYLSGSAETRPTSIRPCPLRRARKT